MLAFYIYLNTVHDCRPVADWAKSAGVKQFLYISSAGIYKPSDELPHVEGVRNASNCSLASNFLYSCNCLLRVLLLHVLD